MSLATQSAAILISKGDSARVGAHEGIYDCVCYFAVGLPVGLRRARRTFRTSGTSGTSRTGRTTRVTG